VSSLCGVGRRGGVDQEAVVVSGQGDQGVVETLSFGTYAFPALSLTDDECFVMRLERVALIRDWFRVRYVDVSRIRDDELLAVTCAPNCVVGGGAVRVKAFVKLVAVSGDVVLKLLASLAAGGAGASAADYSGVVSGHTNVKFAMLLESSGMRSCCMVEGLAVESKANATMLEAVVGLVAVRLGLQRARDVALALGVALVPGVSRVCVSDRKFVGLNSRQYSRALDLVVAGDL